MLSDSSPVGVDAVGHCLEGMALTEGLSPGSARICSNSGYKSNRCAKELAKTSGRM
jgi:hypothetical protein